jgi:two-component system sensor histidine kinase ChvG
MTADRSIAWPQGLEAEVDAEAAEPGPEAAEARGEAAAKARRRWFPVASPLSRRILAMNVLTLAIPIGGLLYLDQYRDRLVTAELDSLRSQGKAFAVSLGVSAIGPNPYGGEVLLPVRARLLVRLLTTETGTRARLFDQNGELMADSFTLMAPGGGIEVEELPPPEKWSGVSGLMDKVYDATIGALPRGGSYPPYRESPVQRAQDYTEVERALRGESASMVRSDPTGTLVLSIALPVQRYRQVLGALMLSRTSTEIEAAVREVRVAVVEIFGIALCFTVLISLYLSSTIARPITRLAAAADQVRYGKGRHVSIPDLTKRGDEIGDLSAALREMTESMSRRLDAIESFAADVAHEIKNPLTSLRSAVETVARVRDPLQQKRLMEIVLDDIQRLDRLISDISDASRLDAELSRASTAPVDLSRLLTTLVEIQQATAADYPRFELKLPQGRPLIVPGIEERLGQVVRNLISNAISFSPPTGTIRLSASRDPSGWARITVEDEGPGLPEGTADAIFKRFYTERPPDEKFGTHSGLGLSISKQIVEAHRGTIQAENRVDDKGRVCGARFIIRLPLT